MAGEMMDVVVDAGCLAECRQSVAAQLPVIVPRLCETLPLPNVARYFMRDVRYAEPENGAADIVLTDAPKIVDGAVNMLLELWPGFDHERLKEPIPEGEDVSVFYIASCVPDPKLVKYMCVVFDKDGEETAQEYIMTEQEKAALWQAMSMRCYKVKECSLIEYVQSEGQ